MKKNSQNRVVYFMTGFSVVLVFLMLFVLASCGGATTKQEEGQKDDEAFYKTQPVHSGLYDVDYYDIAGTNARKGPFDGRLYVALSPYMSTLYVFENGNRTKIDYLVNLSKPFEKNDSGVYVTTDKNDLPVTIAPDSAKYVLTFTRNGDEMKYNFSPTPRQTGNALDIMESIANQKNKNK